jgi:hypothetical protein
MEFSKKFVSSFLPKRIKLMAFEAGRTQKIKNFSNTISLACPI